MASKKSVFLSGFLGIFLGSVLTLVSIVPYTNTKLEEKKEEFQKNEPKSSEQVIDKKAVESSQNYINIYKDIVKEAMPSVVGVTTETTVTNINDIYSFMFGYGQGSSRVVQGVGTGVIVDSNGYILTNSHVVEDGKVDKVTVLLNDGSQEPAKVEWTDRNLDLAIIKIEGKNLPVAKLGDSDKVEVGDIAVAIGNPLGLEFERTVTQGIISGLERTISSPQIGSMSNLIQTDASINQGNSGGPLLNANGEVIGINTIKVGGEGLGFSIPINTAKVFIDILKENGEIKDKPILGISGVSISQLGKRGKEEFGLNDGVLVVEVGQDTPADRADIKPDDIIIKLNDDDINNMSDLQESLYKNGQDKSNSVSVIVVRDGKEHNVEVNFNMDGNYVQDTEDEKNKNQLPTLRESLLELIPN